MPGNSSFNISKDSLATIVERIINETDGVELYLGTKTKLLHKLSSTLKASPVKIKNQGGVLGVRVPIIVKRGRNVPSLCESIQKAIKKSIQEMAGAVVSRVSITVVDCVA